MAEGDAAKLRLQADPEFGSRTERRFWPEQERKQANREAVGTKALNEWNALPLPVENSDTPPEMDVDWMNIFSRYAEDASSDHLRILWAKILAKEISRPKSISLSTLRVVSELDYEIAMAFQEAAKTRLPDGFVPKPSNLRNA